VTINGQYRAMTLKNFFLISVIILIILIASANASATSIQYFHQPGCHDCEKTDPIIIELAHSDNHTIVEWIDISAPDGYNKWKQYGFLEVPAVVLNNEIQLPKDEITKDNLKNKIATLQNNQSIANEPVTQSGLSIPIAFSLGLFAGFSPCLVAILGFIFSVTAGKSSSIRSGMCMAIIFGFGLITAYLLAGVAFILFRGSVPDVKFLSFTAGIISLVFGLNLIGILRMPHSIDAFFQEKTRKHIGTWTGLFGLGLLFSIVKVPCSAPMLIVLLEQMFDSSSFSAILHLLVFCAGILTPFLVIGLIGGATLTQKVRRFRRPIQIISGIFLLIFGIWVIL
jgi:cytochrome c-type biogenesis protein